MPNWKTLSLLVHYALMEKYLAYDRIALERFIPIKLSALSVRLITALPMSLYLSSHNLEIACKEILKKD